MEQQQQLKIERDLKKLQDKYDLQGMQELGQGANGTVYLIQEKATQQWRAIKQIKTQKQSQCELILKECQIQNGFHHEYLMKNKEVYLITTPGIIPGTFDHTFFIVMEMAPNSIYSIIEQEQEISEQQLLEYLYQSLLGLQYLKSKKIAHNDIKPDNILIGQDGKIKISDFGLSDFQKNSHSQYSFRGNKSYVSPIIFQILNHDPFKSDIFSLGLCFLNICLGVRISNFICKKLNENKGNLQRSLEIVRQDDKYRNITVFLTSMLEFDQEQRVDVQQCILNMQTLPIIQQIYINNNNNINQQQMIDNNNNSLNEEKVAIVIINENYDDENKGNLPMVKRDQKQMTEYLSLVGFQKIHGLYDASLQQLTTLQKDILEKAQRFNKQGENYKKNKQLCIWVHYSGHGFAKSGYVCIQLKNSDVFEIERQFLKQLQLCKNVMVFATIDCCRNEIIDLNQSNIQFLDQFEQQEQFNGGKHTLYGSKLGIGAIDYYSMTNSLIQFLKAQKPKDLMQLITKFSLLSYSGENAYLRSEIKLSNGKYSYNNFSLANNNNNINNNMLQQQQQQRPAIQQNQQVQRPYNINNINNNNNNNINNRNNNVQLNNEVNRNVFNQFQQQQQQQPQQNIPQQQQFSHISSISRQTNRIQSNQNPQNQLPPQQQSNYVQNQRQQQQQQPPKNNAPHKRMQFGSGLFGVQIGLGVKKFKDFVEAPISSIQDVTELELLFGGGRIGDTGIKDINRQLSSLKMMDTLVLNLIAAIIIFNNFFSFQYYLYFWLVIIVIYSTFQLINQLIYSLINE